MSDLPPVRVRVKPRRVRVWRQRCSYLVPMWTVEDEEDVETLRVGKVGGGERIAGKMEVVKGWMMMKGLSWGGWSLWIGNGEGRSGDIGIVFMPSIGIHLGAWEYFMLER